MRAGSWSDDVREVRNKTNVRSGKRAETWSGGCERGPGPTIVREVRNPANVMRRNVELAFREVVLMMIPNQSNVVFIFGFEQLRPLRPFSLFIYLGTILQNHNGGPFRLWEREASRRS